MGVFRQINGGQEPHRHGHGQGNGRNQQGAGEQRHRPETAFRSHLVGTHGGLRTPVGAEEKFGKGHLVEKADGLEQHGQQNAQSGQNGHGGAEHEQDTQGLFHAQTGVKVRAYTPQAPARAQYGHGHHGQGHGGVVMVAHDPEALGRFHQLRRRVLRIQGAAGDILNTAHDETEPAGVVGTARFRQCRQHGLLHQGTVEKQPGTQ